VSTVVGRVRRHPGLAQAGVRVYEIHVTAGRDSSLPVGVRNRMRGGERVRHANRKPTLVRKKTRRGNRRIRPQRAKTVAVPITLFIEQAPARGRPPVRGNTTEVEFTTWKGLVARWDERDIAANENAFQLHSQRSLTYEQMSRLDARRKRTPYRVEDEMARAFTSWRPPPPPRPPPPRVRAPIAPSGDDPAEWAAFWAAKARYERFED